MRDKKGTHRFWGVLFYLALMVTIVSASYAGVRFCSNLVTEQSYERLRDAAEAFAVGTKNGQQGKEKNKAAKRMERESEAGDDRPEGIDFAELSSINPDIYAWIRIPDTQIDYPVLQREENDTYYLRHNSSGRYAFAGSIYTEEANSRDFKDPMTVLYGHNMRDGSMFQNLHFFEDETFFAEHPEFFIYLPGYRLTYEIFAAYRFDDTHLLGAFDFSKKKDKSVIMNEIHKRMHNENLTEDEWNEIRATYLGMCMKVDYQFGRIVNALKEKGIYDDTAIFFLSDHGDFTGDYSLVEKAQNTFEDCLVRVPFIIKPPADYQVDAGINNNLTELIDFYATAMDMAGVKPNHTHYGNSLVKNLKDKNLKNRDFVCCEGGREAGEIHCDEYHTKGPNGPAIYSDYYPRQNSQKDDLAHAKGIMLRDERYKFISRLKIKLKIRFIKFKFKRWSMKC